MQSPLGTRLVPADHSRPQSTSGAYEDMMRQNQRLVGLLADREDVAARLTADKMKVGPGRAGQGRAGQGRAGAVGYWLLVGSVAGASLQ
jgi:hypothetical protein